MPPMQATARQKNSLLRRGKTPALRGAIWLVLLVLIVTPNAQGGELLDDSFGVQKIASGKGETSGLFVISPGGKLMLHKPISEFSANVVFGGPKMRNVYQTAVFAQPQSGQSDFKTDFLRLCEIACRELNLEPRKPPRHGAFYVDSYAVRALAVAHDVTAKPRYLDACKVWCDRMLDDQERMTPAGAYHMNYGRKPGQNTGGWYVADSACIAMGVLAIAARCADPADRQRYLASVESFARLVIDNYVGGEGGITDGLWEKYDGEWWCSSGTFASLAFLLYDQTGKREYLEVALAAIDWLNRLEFSKVKHISFEDAAPSVIMYVFEAYTPAMPHLEPESDRRKGAQIQIAKALAWMAENQHAATGEDGWDYNSQWGSKLGSLPFQMYVFARHLPDRADLATAADEELRHVGSVIFADGDPPLSQLVAFTMVSYAEKVSPGGLYRK
jgi:glycosyl hydrolase family 76